MLITFSGLDGAGKSTLTTYVQLELARVRRHAVIYHMNRQVGLYAYLRLLRNLIGRSPNPAPSEWTSAVRSRQRVGRPETLAGRARGILIAARNALIWNKWIRRLLYPVDLTVFVCYRLYIEHIRRQVLIMDRYFYDTLVDVSDGHRWLWVRVLEKLTPTPDVAVYVDVDPEVAFARKGEYTVEYLRHRHERYRAVFNRIESRLTLASGDLAESKARLREAVLGKLSPQ